MSNRFPAACRKHWVMRFPAEAETAETSRGGLWLNRQFDMEAEPEGLPPEEKKKCLNLGNRSRGFSLCAEKVLIWNC